MGSLGKKDAGQLLFPNIPNKLFFKISDVASLSNVEPHVLRYWESEFNELMPRKTASGRRQYNRRDIEIVMEIKSLLYEEGFSIAGAKKRLQKRKKTDTDRDKIIEAVRQVKKGLVEIMAILNA